MKRFLVLAMMGLAMAPHAATAQQDPASPERPRYVLEGTAARWLDLEGYHTRFGDVRELLAEVDDRMVVFGSGDELAIELDAAALPALPAGWRRSLLLRVDGWAKDGDPNTAHSQTVEPLPFHGMSQYPYGAAEGFPDGPAHRLWRERTLTRPALRLVRPLRAGAATTSLQIQTQAGASRE